MSATNQFSYQGIKYFGTDQALLDVVNQSNKRFFDLNSRFQNLTEGLYTPGDTEPTFPVDSGSIADGSILTQHLADSAVTEAKVAASAISTAKIIDGAITTLKIANANITEALIAAAAVTTTKIADDAVTTPKLIAGSVVATKIASGAVETDKLAANAVTAAKIAALTITAAEIAALTITGAKIAAGTLTADKLSVSQLSAITADLGSVTAGQIVVGSTNKLWLNDAADGALNIGGSVKGSAPFRVTNAGALTSTSGVIAGFTISSTGFTAGSGSSTVILTSDLTGTGLTLGGGTGPQSLLGRSFLDLSNNGSAVATFGSDPVFLDDGAVFLYDSGTLVFHLSAHDAKFYFGSTSDVNLYRSAADTLKTDDAFIAGAGSLLATNYFSSVGIELNFTDSGDRNSALDFHSHNGVDYSARIIRQPGANGVWEFVNTGTGDFYLNVASGTLKFGTHTALGSETLSGYITIKDAGGTTRKLAVIS